MKVTAKLVLGIVLIYQLQSSSGITENEKAQVQNGLKAAANLMTFLKEKNFFSMLTKISSVAGPLFSVANVALMIVFMFIDVESPEMALMKQEFGKLNSRLDVWSGKFLDVKRKIQWNSVQVSYADYETSIRTLHRALKFITKGTRGSMETERRIFINKYEATFLDSLENLYYGMVNTDMLFSENLFRASQEFTEYDRLEVQNFMTGVFQLMVQGIQVQAVYINLKYNSTEANRYMESVWQKKLNILKEKMSEIDTDTKYKYEKQYVKDVDNLLAKHRGLSNQDFANVILNFITKKYYWRDWFSVTYGEIGTFREHAISECNGIHRFRTHGRNFFISSRSRESYRPSNQHQLLNNILNNFETRPKFYNNNWALNLILDLKKKVKMCTDAYNIAAVQWGSNVWYWHSGGVLAYKKICVYGGGKWCFNTFMFG